MRLQARFAEPAPSMSDALRTRCMDIIGKGFGGHVLRRYAGVAAHIRYLEEHPDDLGVPEHQRRGVNRGMGWSSDARKMGSMQYEQGAIDCLNFSAMYQLGYDKTDEWTRQRTRDVYGGYRQLAASTGFLDFWM